MTGQLYFTRLSERVQTWKGRHPDRFASIEAKVREKVGWPESALQKMGQQLIVEAMVREAVRQEAGWPTYEEWRVGK